MITPQHHLALAPCKLPIGAAGASPANFSLCPKTPCISAGDRRAEEYKINYIKQFVIIAVIINAKH